MVDDQNNAGAGQRTLHLLISNQSLAADVADLSVTLDGTALWRGQLSAGQQHEWTSTDAPVAVTGLTLGAVEETSGTRAQRAIDPGVADVWAVVAFHGPPAEIAIDLFDHPVALM